VTNLVIPTLNDRPEQIRELSQWVRANLGKETPLHFSGFTPMYRMRHLPPTSLQTLETARDIAVSEGLEYVYIGNRRTEKGENTYCPQCRRLLVARVGFTVVQNRLADGKCPNCGTEIYGVWR